MVRQASVIIAMVQVSTSMALGGIVTFDPPVIELDAAALPAEVSFSISVTPESLPFGPNGEQVFDNVTLHFMGFEHWYVNFEYTPQFVSDTVFRSEPPRVCPTILPCTFIPGGFATRPLVAPYRIGDLVLEVPMDVTPGDYRIVVDSGQDGGFSSIGVGVKGEGLLGSGIVRVVPEPGTVALLLIGAVALGWRRRALVGKPPVALDGEQDSILFVRGTDVRVSRPERDAMSLAQRRRTHKCGRHD